MTQYVLIYSQLVTTVAVIGHVFTTEYHVHTNSLLYQWKITPQLLFQKFTYLQLVTKVQSPYL